jgi:hypothetical protein
MTFVEVADGTTGNSKNRSRSLRDGQARDDKQKNNSKGKGKVRARWGRGTSHLFRVDCDEWGTELL